MFETTLRSDKRKSPTMYKVEYLTYDECKVLGSHAKVLDKNGKIADVKITSVKTWKRRADVEIHCKYGMYEFFSETVTPDRQQSLFVKIIDD